jgi:molybdopterin-guanine dinucleotide biosynthesis protein A
MSSSPPDFTAVLLAGGKSTRMGRDKATLLLDDVPLWQRQLATLHALNPAELLVSGPVDGPWCGSGVQCIPDETPGAGPIGALATILPRMRCGQAVVLAVDLPDMTTAYLARLLDAAAGERGIVPVLDDRFEPLAAIYPRTMHAIAARRLAAGHWAMQEFVREGIAAGLLEGQIVSQADRWLFRNVNVPADLAL